MSPSEAAQQTLRLTRLLDASPEQVFDAWTDADNLRAWFLPGPVEVGEIVCEPRVNGTLRIVLKGAEGDLTHDGVFVALERPRMLAFTWRSHATSGAETLVTIELAPKGRQTELVLTHERLPDRQAATQHEAGWTAVLDTLVRRYTA